MESYLIALQSVFTLSNLVAIFLGTFFGILIGALPGLSVNVAITLLFPFSLVYDGVTGILMLLGTYCGAIYGGSISAILINTPGTPGSAATTIDGYPMVRKGQPGRALGLSTLSSVFGGVFSCLALMVCAPLLSKVALSFSSPEYFALSFFGISVITGVSGKSVVKGIIGGLLGLLIATIGMDPMTSRLRFTYGTTYLMGGLGFVPALIGLFAFSQALLALEEAYGQGAMKPVERIKNVFPSRADLKRTWTTMLRSSVIGTFIGAVPGTGGDVAAFISYNEAKRWSKNKEEFGKGAPEGIAAPEAGNNAVSGGALVPLLTLNIPGDGSTAIMLGAFLIQGLSPGPLLFVEQREQIQTIFLGLLIANIIMGILGFSSLKLFSRLLSTPVRFLTPTIFVLTVVGAFCINNSLIDVFVMMLFGVIGYFFIKLDFTLSPIVLGMILGTMAETNLRRTLLTSHGQWSVFLQHPIAIAFLMISALTLCMPLWRSLRGRLRRQPQNTEE